MTGEPLLTITVPVRVAALVKLALESEASLRERTATRAARELLADTETKDKRSASVRIVELLGEAAELTELAKAVDPEAPPPARRVDAGPQPAQGDRCAAPLEGGRFCTREPDHPGRHVGPRKGATAAPAPKPVGIGQVGGPLAVVPDPPAPLVVPPDAPDPARAPANDPEAETVDPADLLTP